MCTLVFFIVTALILLYLNYLALLACQNDKQQFYDRNSNHKTDICYGVKTGTCVFLI